MNPATARLKGATRQLFRQFGSLEAVSELLGVSHAQAGRYQHIDAPDVITVDRAALLEAQEGVTPHVTRTMAALNGHILVAMPTATGAGAWAAHLAATAREAGDVISRLGEALADDGTVTPDEARKLIVDVEQAVSVLSSVRHALNELMTRAG